MKNIFSVTKLGTSEKKEQNGNLPPFSQTRAPFQNLIRKPKDLYLVKALKQIQDLKLLSADLTQTMKLDQDEYYPEDDTTQSNS